MASRDASDVASSICLAKQADLEAVAFSCTVRRLARAAYGLGFRVLRKLLPSREEEKEQLAQLDEAASPHPFILQNPHPPRFRV